MILGGVIYPTVKKPEHRYQEENCSGHAPLPESRIAALSAETERQTAADNTNNEHSTGVDKIVQKSGCLSHVTPDGADSVDRKRVFFQRPGSSQYDSFFTLAQEAKKSGRHRLDRCSFVDLIGTCLFSFILCFIFHDALNEYLAADSCGNMCVNCLCCNCMKLNASQKKSGVGDRMSRNQV